MGMASAHTAFADDFTGVYYNPAALTAATEGGFGLGFEISRPNLSLQFDRTNRLVRDLTPPSANGITFGALFPLGGASVRNRIALAFALYIPTRSLLDGEALDPAVPYWYMYQALPNRLMTVVGMGVLPFEWLSIGAGVQVLAGVTGSLDYELDLVAGRFNRKTVLFDINPDAAPIFGIELRPIRGLRVGASYRRTLQTSVNLPVNLNITKIASFNVQTSFEVQYDPNEVSFGASYAFEGIGLKLAADATWLQWSHAPDPSVNSAVTVGGDIFTGTGLAQVLNAPAPGQERKVDLAFRDVVVPRVGVEQDLGPFQLRVGYSLRPTPAPLQTSATNYVDGTAHVVSCGFGVEFRDPFQAFANPLMLDFGGSLFVIPTRPYPKVDPDDPVGSFQASGNIIVLGAALRYVFKEAPTEHQPPPMPRLMGNAHSPPGTR